MPKQPCLLFAVLMSTALFFYRYLYLLTGKRQFACVMDSENRVISLPPLTNSDITKVSFYRKNRYKNRSEQSSGLHRFVDSMFGLIYFLSMFFVSFHHVAI